MATAKKRGRPTRAQQVEKIKQRERETKAAEWLEHCERQYFDALRDAPDAAAVAVITRQVRRVLWAHFEALSRGRNTWPPHITPNEARADIEIGEYAVMEHVAEVVQLVHERLEGLHGQG